MTLTTIKSAVRAHMTDDQIRAEYGDLRLRSTWEAAYDKCSEAIALAADAAADAQQPARDTAQAVTDAVYSDLSYKVFYGAMYCIALVVFATFLLTAKVVQLGWQASAPFRHRVSGRIHSEVWAFVGAWPDLRIGL